MALPRWSIALKFFNYVQRARPSSSYVCINGRDRHCFVQRSCIVPFNLYSSDAQAEKSAMGIGPGLNPKKKKVFIPRITLLSEDNEISIVTMEMAEKIANRRTLKLVKIVDFDTKTERPTYKLMSTKDYIQEGMQRKTAKKIDKQTALKPEKLLSISSKIAEHDLMTKIKSVSKLLAKKHEIRLLISVDGNKEKATAIATDIENSMKELPVHMKTSTSGNNIKIYLRPNVQAETSESSDNKSKDNKAEPPVTSES